MNDPDLDLAAAGKQLEQVLKQIFLRLQPPYKPFQFDDHKLHVEEMVRGTIEHVQRETRPFYSKQPFLFSEGVRATRGFEFEYQRLKARALDYYVNSLTDAVPELANVLKTPAFELTLAEMRREVRNYAETLIIPIIEQYPTAGEDLYLYIYGWVWDGDSGLTIENIVSTGQAAPESPLAMYGMLGLLIEARKARDSGDTERAYSFLLDANHLIGMKEGARSATKHLPEVARKLHHVRNSHESRGEKRELRIRIADLFTELRKKGGDGLRAPWPSGAAAAAAIWPIIEKEADDRQKAEKLQEAEDLKNGVSKKKKAGRKKVKDGEKREAPSKPALAESGVLDLCKRLHQHEQDGGTLDIDIRWIRVPPQHSPPVAG
jgi:hypothetical protein